MPTIRFKGKIESPLYVDGSPAPRRIAVPKITTRHVDMPEWHRHPKYGVFSNSDMFPGILRKSVSHIGAAIFPDNLPPGVRVIEGGFLAVVEIDVP